MRGVDGSQGEGTGLVLCCRVVLRGYITVLELTFKFSDAFGALNNP
jgi:hypothetical protein